ncbi:hypothetical protein Tco_0695410 [Tanacetum coccineum]
MHKDIMVAGSKDRLLMLATERYAQWQSHFMRYVDTKYNKKELKKCTFDGPYVMTRVLVLAKPATETYPPIPKHTVPETYENALPETCAYIDFEAKAIHLILSVIRDDIYSTVDACTTAKEMWISIERLQQGESLNKQDVKTNLFWEFGKFTLRDRESIESYYSRTSSNSKNKTVDNSPRSGNDRQSGQFGNQNTMTVAEARETVGNQAEKGVLLRAEQGDWLDDTDEDLDEQKLESNYMYMAKIQEHSEQPESINDTYVVEKVDSNVIPDSSDMCDNDGKDDPNAEEYEDERVVLANLIANLKLDTDPNDIWDRCRSALHQKGVELEKYKTYKYCQVEKDDLELKFLNDVVYKTNQSVQTIHMLAPNSSLYYNGKASFVNPLYLKKAKSEKPCLYHVSYDKDDLENIFAPNSDETLILEQESKSKIDKDIKKSRNVTVLRLSFPNKTENVTKEVYIELLRSFAKLKKHSISLELALQQCQEQLKNDKVWKQQESSSLKARLQDKNISISELKKLIKKLKGKFMDTKFDKPSVVQQLNAFRFQKPLVLGKLTPFSDSLERKYFSKTKPVNKTNVSEGISKPVTSQILPQTARQAVRNTNVIKPGMYRIDTRTTKTRAPQLPQTTRDTNPYVSNSTEVIHRTSVSRPQLRSTQMKDKVAQNNSQVKIKKTKVEDHHRIYSFSNKIKSVIACNDSLKSKTSNVNDVCATCGKCVFNANHDACVTEFLNKVNSRAKVPSHKTTSKNKLVEQISVAKKPERHIPTGHRFSIKKNYVVHVKTKTPRSCLR